MSARLSAFFRDNRSLPLWKSTSAHDLLMICPWSAHDLPMICPWSAHDLPMICPYIYRGLPSKCAKNFVLVNFFRFCKNREKSQETQWKTGFFRHFFLRKSAFFIKQSSQKCIIKTIHFCIRNAEFFQLKNRYFFEFFLTKNVIKLWILY